MVSTSLQSFALAIVVVFPTLTIIIVALRVHSRTTIGEFGWDDALVVVATVLSIGESCVMWGFIKTNFVGIHVYDIPPDADKVLGLKYNFAVQVLYNPILAIVKDSVLLFMLRLAGTRKSITCTVWVLLITNTMLMVAIFITVIFQCTPIEFNWNLSIEGGHCVKQGVFYVATSALTLLTDILVILLPVWIVMNLKMARKTKIAVIGIFCLGGIVTIVGAVRLWLIIKGFILAPTSKDPTYDIGFCTSAIETNMAIITASAPAMKPLFKKWFPRLFSTANSGYASGPYQGVGSSYGRTASRRHTAAPRHDGHITTVESVELKGMRGKVGMSSAEKSGSEDEIMTYNGIVKTTDVSIRYGERGSRSDGLNRSRSKVTLGRRRSIDSGV